MAEQENKENLRRFYEDVMVAGKLDLLEELAQSDTVDHTFGFQGLEATRQFLETVRTAFPDMEVDVHEIVADGDSVAVRVTYRGTHSAEFMGMPATNRKVEVDGVDFLHMRDGKQAEHWGGPDMAGLMRQLSAGDTNSR
jgi:steroid delta-isomerase-like uncharacterized protein